jgi:hypothetical protein
MIPTIATGRPKYKRMIRLAALSNPPRHLHVYLALLSRSLRTPIPPTSRTLNLIGIDSDRKRLDAARRYRGNRLPDARRRSVQENSQGTELNQTRMRIRSPATQSRYPQNGPHVQLTAVLVLSRFDPVGHGVSRHGLLTGTAYGD